MLIPQQQIAFRSEVMSERKRKVYCMYRKKKGECSTRFKVKVKLSSKKTIRFNRETLIYTRAHVIYQRIIYHITH